MRTKFILLLAFLALVVGGWTVAWFNVRDTVVANLDRGLEDLSAEGIVVTCPDRAVGGWPFRVTVTCEGPDVRLPDGSTLQAARLESNGTVNDPTLIVSRLAAPISFQAGTGETVTAEFSSLTTSFRAGPSGSQVPEVSVAADDLAAQIGSQGLAVGTLQASRAEAHLRPTPSNDGDVEFVLTLADATAAAAGADVLPAPADAGVLMTMRKTNLLDGSPAGLQAWSAAGGTMDLTQAALDIGETRIEVTGTGTVDAQGFVAADLTATATGIDWLTSQASTGKPLNPALAALGSAFLLIGKQVDGAGNPRTLAIDVSNGAVTANGLPLGSAPRVF